MLARAQVRVSGTGVHAIICLATPIMFRSEAERQRWAATVKVVQRLLPTDPDVTCITAMTRPVGSVNGKNGRRVCVLAEGKPVTAKEMLVLFKQVQAAPVRTVMQILLGAEQVSPCPICKKEGTTLSAPDRVPRCYGACGRVTLSQLYDLFLRPRPERKGEEVHGKN